MIMKKDYMHPEAEEVNVVVAQLLALSESEDRGDDTLPEATNDRRGTWGDVWGSER